MEQRFNYKGKLSLIAQLTLVITSGQSNMT